MHCCENQGQCLTPFQRKLLLKSLQTNIRPEYRRRIEIMLLADTGQSQSQICKAVGCSPEMARYWMVIAQTGQVHHWNDYPMGRPKTVNEQLNFCASHGSEIIRIFNPTARSTPRPNPTLASQVPRL